MMPQQMPLRRDLGQDPDTALHELSLKLHAAGYDGAVSLRGDHGQVVVQVAFANGHMIEFGGMGERPEYSVWGEADELHEYDGHRPREDAFPLRWTHATAANMLEWASIRCERVSRL